MRSFAFLRARRRTSAAIVFALLMLGAVQSLHHHRLVGTQEALEIEASSVESHQARSVDCVICRATDPVRLVVAHESAPPVVESASFTPALRAVVSTSSARWFSPRAPPSAA